MNQFIFYFFILSSSVVMAQDTVDIQKQLLKQLQHKDFKHASIGISVYDYDNDQTLIDINAQKALVPASTLKLLTTLTAMHHLGPNFAFRTRLSYSGEIRDGILYGDLYIEGGGDPTLGSHKMGVHNAQKLVAFMVLKVQEACIEGIRGKVIADESIFDSYPISPSWQWNDIGNYYASGAWGINVNENQYSIYFGQRDKIGTRPKLVGTNPKIPGLKLSNEVILDSAGTGDQAYVFGGPYNYEKRIVGAIPIGRGNFSIKGSIPNPPLFLAQFFASKLAKNHIFNEGATTNYRKSSIKRNRFSEILSPPLSKVVRRCNFESNNLYCEAIFKIMAFHIYKEGSGAYGIRMVDERVKELGLKSMSLHMEDGSGLSARNHVSPLLMSKFLGKNIIEIGLKNMKQIIPKVGEQGTVKGMYVKGKTWAKSGSMGGILNYVGIMQTKSGKYVTFAIMVNHFQVKQQKMRQRIVGLLNGIYEGL